MAKIQTNINEKIFNISAWRGVNEATEGEARLKFGEAAVMRNFCVTSGGALKKRPGSLNVAGLLSAYTAHVKEGSRQLMLTDEGAGASFTMYPRMTADEVGVVRPAGNPVTVTSANAGQYKGCFFEYGGRLWALEECVIRTAAGTEDVGGGRGTPGAPAAFASGAESWTKEGGPVFTGTEYVDTYGQVELTVSPRPGAVALRDGVYATLLGAPTRRGAPAGTAVGFETTDAGGYFVRDGVLYKYYGARVDGYSCKRSWKKYRCVKSDMGYTYYTEGEWVWEGTSQLKGGWIIVYPGYIFNESNGTYRTIGQETRLEQGGSGSGYAAFRNQCAIVELKGSTVTTATSTAQGPFTGYRAVYTKGEYLGDVAVGEGALPEAEKGYVYEASFSDGGVNYTVMRLGEDLCCYAEETGVVGSSAREYTFWACPMSVSVNAAEWYGSETCAVANEMTDTQVRGIWSGFVGGREVLCAACGGMLWELKGGSGDGEEVWTKVPAGEMDTSRDVHMFGFDEKLWILNGEKYLVWDGERLSEVEGYRPLVSVSVAPAGGGTLLEGINRLSAGRRCRFSPDGEAVVFRLPEGEIQGVDWVKDLTGTGAVPSWEVDTAGGTVTFSSPPARGINTLEIAWSAKESLRGQVCAMRFAEIFNGAQDSRVFLYGDGSNRAFYSGLDYDGKPRADYFPDLYEVAVGDANTPVTALIRHYNKLMAFKPDSAWSIGYDTITLVDGTVTAGFYVAPVNRAVGNCAYGQAQLVQNRPRTLDGRSVIEWRATSSSGGITGDQRNAERVSQRVDASIRRFDLARARTFYDKFSHEYFVIGEDGTAIVQNLDVDAWYVYTGLDVTCMINYRDELYYGTRDGFLRHFSDRYASDNGRAIDAWWESGAMSFSEDFRRKYSAMVWIGIKPEDNGYLEVTAQTDRKSDLAVYDVRSANGAGVPEMERIKLKAKKFTYYKLILRNNTADRTCTVVSADMRVRGTGYVR